MFSDRRKNPCIVKNWHYDHYWTKQHLIIQKYKYCKTNVKKKKEYIYTHYNSCQLWFSPICANVTCRRTQTQQTNNTEQLSKSLSRTNTFLTGSQSGRGGHSQHTNTLLKTHTPASEPWRSGGSTTLDPWALAWTIWQLRGNFQLVSRCYVVDVYEVRSAQRTALAKLGPVVAVCHWGGQRIDKNHRRDRPLCDAHLENAH